VAIVFQGSLAPASHFLDAFKQGLAARGWREGENIEYIFREGLNDPVRLDAIVSQVVAEKPDVILGTTAPVAVAIKKRTNTVPIVFSFVPDPVAAGLVATFARPGSNATGTTVRFEGMWGKRLQLLQEMLPGLRRVGFLYDPADLQDADAPRLIRAAAKELNLETELFSAARLEDLKPAFSAMKSGKIEAVMIGGNQLYFVQRKVLADLALANRIPSLFATTEGVEAGMLLGYNANLLRLMRQSASYVDRILKGAKPGDLPVEQPSVIELAVNVKVAKELGIKVPQSILVRADRVIE
jgi:putative ABC transport system substrate-binding protein